METPKPQEDEALLTAADGDQADEEARAEQSDSSYDEDDEATIRARLEALGYL